MHVAPNLCTASVSRAFIFESAAFVKTVTTKGISWEATRMSCKKEQQLRKCGTLVVLFIFQVQIFGFDVDNRPTTDICSTHTILPGPKGEEYEVTNVETSTDKGWFFKIDVERLWHRLGMKDLNYCRLYKCLEKSDCSGGKWWSKEILICFSLVSGIVLHILI